MPDNTDMLKFPSHGMHMHGAFSISRDPKIDSQILRGDILLEAGDSPLEAG